MKLNTQAIGTFELWFFEFSNAHATHFNSWLLRAVENSTME